MVVLGFMFPQNAVIYNYLPGLASKVNRPEAERFREFQMKPFTPRSALGCIFIECCGIEFKQLVPTLIGLKRSVPCSLPPGDFSEGFIMQATTTSAGLPALVIIRCRYSLDEHNL
jgi:hypothetical protein